MLRSGRFHPDASNATKLKGSLVTLDLKNKLDAIWIATEVPVMKVFPHPHR